MEKRVALILVVLMVLNLMTVSAGALTEVEEIDSNGRLTRLVTEKESFEISNSVTGLGKELTCGFFTYINA